MHTTKSGSLIYTMKQKGHDNDTSRIMEYIYTYWDYSSICMYLRYRDYDTDRKNYGLK